MQEETFISEYQKLKPPKYQIGMIIDDYPEHGKGIIISSKFKYYHKFNKYLVTYEIKFETCKKLMSGVEISERELVKILED
jgi:hypothetical protein